MYERVRVIVAPLFSMLHFPHQVAHSYRVSNSGLFSIYGHLSPIHVTPNPALLLHTCRSLSTTHPFPAPSISRPLPPHFLVTMHSAGTRASILSSYSIGAVFLLAIAMAMGPPLITPDPKDVSVRVNSLAFLYARLPRCPKCGHGTVWPRTLTLGSCGRA